MRGALTGLAACAACAASLAALAAGSAASGSTAHAAPRAVYAITLAPGAGDVALAQLSFQRVAHLARAGRGSVQIAARAPFAADYLVAAALAGRRGRAQRVLVLLANRVTDLADPTKVNLRASIARGLGRPKVLRATNVLRGFARRPALCNLPLHGRPLLASQLRVLNTRGAALTGLSAAAALAEAYDLACGLAHSSALREALARPGASATPPNPGLPLPPPPVNVPPAPTPPGCAPCPPGAACPQRRPSVCTTEPRRARRRAGAH